jgi:phage baseplate assembly protein gpV
MITAENMVRVGVVSSIDAASKTARVIFPDSADMVSGWLYVIQHPMSGSTGYAGTPSHRHSISGSGWMPAVKDRVLCLMMVGSETDGYILGGIP